MKTARRLFSLALVLVMVLSLSVTAFATSDDPAWDGVSQLRMLAKLSSIL